ncbi:hypothetical protein OSB04_024438 [Centaurea solstitialis]|uniref:Reverse transcriptase Ty1/copia-type domain-containing protein n=1 Tax=Centaurea solstitialis TaxID=347529 RepID=A0AA38WDV0_9ASTR|nr:hypothetical protein OSB04_024438 [Centaurea solstitialis]
MYKSSGNCPSEMSMLRELSFFLGLQVLQKPEGILINQSKYIGDLLKRFHMDKSSVAKTLMASGTLIGADPKGKPVDQKTYRAIIGSLLYLTASRPDIMFATCFCARFQANPKESHMLAVKRVLQYLRGTPNRGLWYPKESGFELVTFSDADHGGCQLDRKSTSGQVQSGLELLNEINLVCFGGTMVRTWPPHSSNPKPSSQPPSQHISQQPPDPSSLYPSQPSSQPSSSKPSSHQPPNKKKSKPSKPITYEDLSKDFKAVLDENFPRYKYLQDTPNNHYLDFTTMVTQHPIMLGFYVILVSELTRDPCESQS